MLKWLINSDLLQGWSTQFNGDVRKETVSLCAEVPDDVRVSVRLSEKLHLSLCNLDTLRQDSLHSYIASIKFTSNITNMEDSEWLWTMYSVSPVNCMLITEALESKNYF